MIFDNEKQRTIILGVLGDIQLHGNYNQMKEAILNLSEVITAVQNATVEVKDHE